MTIHRHTLPAPTSPSAISRSTSGENNTTNNANNFSFTNSNSTTRTQSSASLTSILSNLTATTDYSPTLIQTEVGDLLSIDDIGLDGEQIIIDACNCTKIPSRNHIYNKKNKGNFQFNIDSESDSEIEYDEDHNNTNDNDDTINEEDDHKIGLNIPNRLKMSRTKSSSDNLCGKSRSDLFNDPVNYDDPNLDYHKKWFICLIGLPACGKSTIVNHFIDFVSKKTQGKVRVQNFNAGDIRRKYENSNKNKFDFNNRDSKKLRDFYAFESLQSLTDSLIKDNIDIGILDATNTTVLRRESVFEHVSRVSEKSGVKINPVILEVKCLNKSLRRFNIEMKSHNKDYINMPKDQAILNFLKRIEKYESVYEKVTVNEIKSLGVKYFSITNVGDSICYDCGLTHHDSKRHQDLKFKSIALNLIYEFLMTYRTTYALPYLIDVDNFYTKGHYKPVITAFSSPSSSSLKSLGSSASLASVYASSKAMSKAFVPPSTMTSLPISHTTSSDALLPKVLSSPRISSSVKLN